MCELIDRRQAKLCRPFAGKLAGLDRNQDLWEQPGILLLKDQVGSPFVTGCIYAEYIND
jgi:hypothetical protein